jgi:hypothetical protein
MDTIFHFDDTFIKTLERFYREFPKESEQAVSGILNDLAYQTRQNDIENISGNMIIRNRQFLERSLQYTKARPGRIESQVAYVYSVKRERFTGWEEQQTGRNAVKERSATLPARGGSRAGVMNRKSRLRGQFYKPQQFQGHNIKQRFQFMMRVLNTRGGGEFIVSDSIPTKRGTLKRGLYSLRNHQLTKYQSFEDKPIKQLRWRNMSLDQLARRNNINKLWSTHLNRVINKYKQK